MLLGYLCCYLTLLTTSVDCLIRSRTVSHIGAQQPCVAGHPGLRQIPSCSAEQEKQTLDMVTQRWASALDPKRLPHEASPEIEGVLVASTSLVAPEYSISYPVHNHGHLLAQTLQSLLLTTCGSYEMVITLDRCTDNSSSAVWNTLESFVASNRCATGPGPGEVHPVQSRTGQRTCCGMLTRVIVYKSETDMFETAADNLAMSVTSPVGFYILAQADTHFYEQGWNVHLSLPARRNSDVMAVSGRCGHSFNECGGDVSSANRFGDCTGVARNDATFLNYFRFAFLVTDVIVRSPMLLRATHVQQLGLFDQVHYRLGGDDKDLCRRGYFSHGWISGFVPIDVQDERGRHGAIEFHDERGMHLDYQQSLESNRVLHSEWQARNASTPMLNTSSSRKKLEECSEPSNRYIPFGQDGVDSLSEEIMRVATDDLHRFGV